MHPSAGGRERASHQPSRRRELDSVGEEVRDDREELVLVDARGQWARGVHDEALAPRLGDRAQAIGHLVHHARHVDIDGLDDSAAALEASELQQLVDLAQQDVGVRADPLNVGRRAVRHVGVEHPGAEPQDDRQRRLQLVADVGDQLTPRLVERANAPNKLLEVQLLEVSRMSGDLDPPQNAITWIPAPHRSLYP